MEKAKREKDTCYIVKNKKTTHESKQDLWTAMVESKGTFAFIAFLLLLKCIGNRCLTCNISIHHVGVNNLFCGADLPAEKVTARSVEGV